MVLTSEGVRQVVRKPTPCDDSGMDNAALVAVGTVVLGALLGGVIQATNAWRDRNREGRAAAQVVWDALTEALRASSTPLLEPSSPVFIDLSGYTAVWAQERKALAR